MSVDQPNPPSIPPRKRPVGSATPHPATPHPAMAAPSATAESGASAKPVERALPEPFKPEPASPAPTPASPERSRATAPAVVAAGSMLKALKSAVTGESSRPSATSPVTTDGDAPRPDSSEAAPAMSSTDTRAASATTPTGAGAPANDPALGRQASGRNAAGSARLPSPAAARDGGPRRVRLSISRVDPWSVMKLSFLLSVAIGIMIVIAAAVVWFALDGLTVFTRVNDMITEIVGQESPIDILQYVEFSRVVSGATVVAVVDVVLLTALSTIGAFLYNITAALVGGVTLTLTDD